MEQPKAIAKTSKTAALTVAVVSSFVSTFLISAVNIALPAIQNEFKIDSVTLSWISTAFLLSMSVFVIPIGKYADIVGRKKVFLIGTILFTCSTTLAFFVRDIGSLIALRVLQGIAGAFCTTTSLAILSSVFPPNERGKAIGMNVSAVYLGLSAGPYLGGIMTHLFSWRAIFLLALPLGVLVIFLILRNMKDEWAYAKGQKFDYIGSVLYAIGIVALMKGVSSLPEMKGIAMVALGLGGLVAFVIREAKIEFPVFEVKLFKNNRVFAYSNIASTINYSASYSLAFLLSLYLQFILKKTASEAGSILIIQPIVMAACSPLSGRLSDRFKPQVVSSIGMLLIACALVSFSFIGFNTNMSYIITLLVVMGLGFGLFSSPNVNSTMGSVEKQYLGIASSSVSTMRMLGQMLSMIITTLIFNNIIGHKQILPENYGAFISSLHTVFHISAAMCLVGVYFSAARGRKTI